MSDDTHPLKQAVIELGTWVDRRRDEPGLESLVDAVREAWMDYVAGSGMFEIPRADGKLAEVITGNAPCRPLEIASQRGTSPTLKLFNRTNSIGRAKSGLPLRIF